MITATISTYNREKYLPKVLNSLRQQTLSPSLFEIVLVDNNSPGNTKEITEEFIKNNPQIDIAYYLETNQGLSYGRNRGIEEAKGEFITFIDDDAYLSPDYLEKLHAYFKKNPTIGAIGGPIELDYEEIIPAWENKYLNSLLGYFNYGPVIKEFKKDDYPRGSNMSFRLNVFKKIGLFNTDLGRKGSDLGGNEEKDLFQRIYRSGEFRVLYLPECLVYHYVPANRTTTEFIRRQALGTGSSERIRLKSAQRKEKWHRYLMELVKWGGSVTLWLIYLFKGQSAKGNMIIRFRWWVSRGLFLGQKNLDKRKS